MNTYLERIKNLRSEMTLAEVDVYIVPTADYHASEYVADHFKTRQYLSGFSGSNGTLVVTQYDAALFTDGRYFIQAEEELKDSDIVLMKMDESGVPKIEDYICDSLSKGETIGYDGKTMPFDFGNALRENLKDKDINFKIDLDLAGRIWKDRPEIPCEKTWILPYKYSGEDTAYKINRIREKLIDLGADGILISALDDIAWVFNIRGNDIEYTPVTLSFAIITDTKAYIYIDKEKITSEVEKSFEENGIIVRPYDSVYDDVKTFPGTLFVDPSSANEKLARNVSDVKFGLSPIAEAKCIKNDIELDNIKKTHLNDAVALTKTIYWIKKLSESAAIFRETELSVSEHLLMERKKISDFLSLSFESIVASNEHGAIIHYEPTEKTNKVIDSGMLLIDSGGQYKTGTTDVTRTISIKEPDFEMKRFYTAVLKGHLDLGMATFDVDYPTPKLDEIARKPIRDRGQDYNHGTGHGVGYILSVHEGPTGFRKEESSKDYPFKRHMVVSNEPGVYLKDKFGIRIENMMYVRGLANRLRFDTLTLVPYDKASINIDELTFEELEELRWYSEKVYTMLSPHLTDEEKMWLREETIY